MTLDLKCRPSSLLEIEDAYTAYCFDEACAYIIRELKDGKEPKIKVQEEEKKGKHYSRPSELYSKYSNVKMHK